MSSDTGNASEICSNDDRSTNRKWSGSHNSKGSPDDEDKEYNKKLLVSLGMLLPAIAAIIGVVAWAISAEVVMGAKREAARRNADPSLRLQNKYDYSKLPSGSYNPLPLKEMLIEQRVFKNDPNDNRFNKDNLDFLNQHMEQMGKDIMMRRMDDDKEDKSAETKTSKQDVGSNDKLKAGLTQENIAQLIEKLLSNQLGKSSKTPQIVVVSPIASQLNKNVSKSSFKTKVTISKPKAFDLKMAPSKEAPQKNNSSSKKKSRVAPGPSVQSTSPKLSSSASSKRKAAPKATINKKKNVYAARTTTKSPEINKSPKNFKAKIYEKEIDLLLQKIEKLEKQQNINTDKKSITEKVANIELLKGKPMDIADKIKTFIAGSEDPVAESSNRNEHFEPNPWQPTMNIMPPPPPPPPPAMQYMPFMPPQMPYGNPSMPMPNVDGEAAANQQVPQYPPNPEQYPNEQPNMGYPDYNQQQQQQQQQQYAPDPQQPNQQQMGQGNYMQPNQYNAPMNNQDPRQLYPNQNQNGMQEMQPNQMDSAYSNQAQQQGYNYNAPNNDNEQNKKTKQPGIFRRKFKLSNILNSVIPKSIKKPETTPRPPPDHREIRPQEQQMTYPQEPMLAQDSQMHSYVDRGHGGGYYEHPGTQMSFGAGPMGGGGQFKASPMGILKTLILPLLPKPRMNLNGKVVFGVVLENGVGFGKKPKTVFQHYSTGRLRK